MGNFLRYALRETGTNLWRNRLMTMAAVLTVTVSLGLLGAALYLKQGAAQATSSWQRQEQVTVWMLPRASNSEVKAIGTELQADGNIVTSCQFWSKARDYREMISISSPEIASVLSVAGTPSSWRCVPKAPADAAVVNTDFKGQPGVFTVTAPESAIHAIQNTVDVLQVVFVGIALALLLSAGVLILNTIRMAIFARRREVSVMKLVGATNWFIRIPFVAEGLIQGLLGALLASGIVYGIHLVIDALSNGAAQTSLRYQMRLSVYHVVMTDVVVMVVGAAIGAVGSAIAVRRFLDV